MENYSGWHNVPDNYKTKTTLRQMGLKPLNEENFQAQVTVRTRFGWKINNLYDIEMTIPIKRRTTNIDHLEITQTIIGEALYLINKSAKKSRDTKVINYELGNHEIVSRSKQRQNKLYDLKDRALSRAIDEGIAELIGYHKQVLNVEHTEWVETDEIYSEYWDNDLRDYVINYVREPQIVERTVVNYLVMYQIDNFTFHLPIDEPPLGTKYLGEIGKITAEQTRKTNLGFNQAVAILDKFISKDKTKAS